MDTERISELTVSLGNCMQGIQRLQKALVMFSANDYQDDGHIL